MIFGRSTLKSLFASALIVADTFAIPHGVGIKEKRQSAPLAVTGFQGSGIQPRLEIRDLQKNGDQFNMYLLALQRMQQLDQNNFQSYFQLSAIHGLPMMDWNGAAGNPSTNPPSGYCTHVSNLFLPWHRPYLAVYEQILVQNAVDIANEFQNSADQQRYRNAAATLRMPYWDWAAPQNGGNIVPNVLVQNTISVNAPTGAVTIENPLYSYKFTQGTQNLVYSPFVSWQRTYRNPVSQDTPTQNNDQGVIDTMNGQQASLASRLFNLFANYNNFAQVSNEAWAQGQQGNYDSIESVHDTVHGLFGGANNGDMSIIDVSAFDPAFWLHHAMVDRFFAMWQALYPNTYVVPTAQTYGNYWYSSGTVMDADSPLLPFHSDTAGNYHTSNSVRDHTRFGYTYRDVTGNPQDTVTAVNTLYGAGQAQAGNKKRGLDDFARAPSEVEDDVTDAFGSFGEVMDDIVADTADLLDDINGYLGVSSPRDYIVNVRTDKNALDGSYQIFVFCGDVPEDQTAWAKSDSLVGIQAITSMKQGSAMGPAIVSGTVPLTHWLEKHVVLKFLGGLSENLVIPYLKDNLSWRVIGSSGEQVPLSQLPDLKLGVVSVALKPTASIDVFPQWVDGFSSHYEATSGKDAGLCPTEED